MRCTATNNNKKKSTIQGRVRQGYSVPTLGVLVPQENSTRYLKGRVVNRAMCCTGCDSLALKMIVCLLQPIMFRQQHFRRCCKMTHCIPNSVLLILLFCGHPTMISLWVITSAWKTYETWAHARRTIQVCRKEKIHLERKKISMHCTDS